MSSSVAFESQTEKEERRRRLRRERNAILAKVEAEYHKKEKRKQRAELQGEESWMLPSVEDRLNSGKELGKIPCSKKKKKVKKCHRHKKYKAKEKCSRSSSASESDEPHEWTEKVDQVATDIPKPRNHGPQLERESWMSIETPFASSLFLSSHSIKEVDLPKNELFDKPGQHRLELNTYWKDGGTGLPEKAPPTNVVLECMTGDAGLGYLRKSLQRCIEMAEEENRTVEEVAAERYGSLQDLQNRIAVAEAKSKSSSAKYGSLKFRRPNEEKEDDKSYSLQSHQRNAAGNWRKKQVQSHFLAKRCANPDSEILHKKTKMSSSKESTGAVNYESSTLENDLCKHKDDSHPHLLSKEEINKLAAQIIKAELIGDEALSQKLKKQLKTSQTVRSDAMSATSATVSRTDVSNLSDKSDDKIALLTRTNHFGMTRPIANYQNPKVQLHGHHRNRKLECMYETSGQRAKYFADDEKYSLKDLVEREKLSTAEDTNMMFARLAGRNVQGDDEDLDDKMIDKAAFSGRQSASLMESKERQLAIIEHKKMSTSLAKCRFCFENVPKHLIVAVGLKVYLCLPKQRSMVKGHCYIVPVQHETQGTKCDEDVWDEMKVFQKHLANMFKDNGEECLFFETSLNLKWYPHMHVECIPVPKETGETAPLYFKKALQECESEWAQNKKILDLSKKDVRQSIPRGFPYFSIDFGMTGGFAHVIEDEKCFSSYFGREVIGGMLDMDETQWRSLHNETFEEQRKKVITFSEQWKHYDWTKQLKSI